MVRSCLIAAFVAAAWPVFGAPFTVDDLLALEAPGPTVSDPAGRWLVLSSTRPWNAAPDYGMGNQTSQALSRIDVVDLAKPSSARPVLPVVRTIGYVPGPAAPDGALMVVHRLRDRARSLGVVSPLSGRVRFFDVHTEPSVWGRTLQWRNPDELIAIDRPPDAPSRRLGFGWQPQVRLQEAWGRAAAGKLSVTPLGGGRYLGVRPTARPDELVLIDVRTGRRRPLAKGEFIDLEISPDGRWIAALREAQDIQPTAGEPVVSTMTNRRRRLVVVDLESGGIFEPFAGRDIATGLLAWSARGSLLTYGRLDGQVWSSGALLRFDAPSRSGSVVETDRFRPILTATPSQEAALAAGWLGEDIVFFGSTLSSAPSWARLGPAGPSMLLVDGASTERGVADWTPDAITLKASGRTAVFTSAAAKSPGVISTFEPEPGVRLLESPAHRLAVDVAIARHRVVDRRGDDGVLRRTLVGPTGDTLVQTLNARLADRTFSKPQPVRHSAPDGRTLTSWLYLPDRPAPPGGFALIVVPYPGTVHATAPTAYAPGVLKLETNVQLMAAQGYAVLAISLPRADGEPADGLSASILLAVNATADEFAVSRSRVVLWGQSYGGWGALMAATQSDRFAAIVATAPIPNLVSRYGALPPQISVIPERGLPIGSALAWAETGQGAMKAPLWAAPERYLRNSPTVLSDRIEAPVMLVYGDLDRDPNEAMALFSALYRQGKDALILTYRGEGHVISTPGNVRDLYERAFAFISDALDHLPGAKGDDARPSPRPPHGAP